MKRKLVIRLFSIAIFIGISGMFYANKLNNTFNVYNDTNFKLSYTNNMNKELTIDPKTTALVLIDLQKGIASIQTAPLSSAEVIANSNKLIDAFHLQKAQVVIVRVAFNKDRSDALHPEVDEPMASNLNALPEDWSTIVPELRCDQNDLFITKHQWGAFYGTELDLQLRRKGIKTIVIGGIATNYGVESTARDGFELGYQMVFAVDAMASRAAADHEFAVTRIFPRMGLVRTTNEIKNALK